MTERINTHSFGFHFISNGESIFQLIDKFFKIIFTKCKIHILNILVYIFERNIELSQLQRNHCFGAQSGRTQKLMDTMFDFKTRGHYFRSDIHLGILSALLSSNLSRLVLNVFVMLYTFSLGRPKSISYLWRTVSLTCDCTALCRIKFNVETTAFI